MIPENDLLFALKTWWNSRTHCRHTLPCVTDASWWWLVAVVAVWGRLAATEGAICFTLGG